MAVLNIRFRTVVTLGDPSRSRTRASHPALWGADAEVPKNWHWPCPPGFAAGQVPDPNPPTPLTDTPSDADQVGATVADVTTPPPATPVHGPAAPPAQTVVDPSWTGPWP